MKTDSIRLFQFITICATALVLPSQAPGGTTNSNIQKNADSTSKQFLVGVGVNAGSATFALIMAKQAKTPPEKTMWYVMAATAAAQSASQMGGSKGARQAATDSQCLSLDCLKIQYPEFPRPDGGPNEKPDGSDLNDPGYVKNNRNNPRYNPGPPTAGNGLRGHPSGSGIPDEIQRQIDKLPAVISDLKKNGYDYDPKNEVLKTPKGVVNPEALGSRSGMAAAGFSKAEIEAFERNKEAAQHEAVKLASKYDSLFGDGDTGPAGSGDRAPASADAGAGGNFDPNAFLKQFSQTGESGKPTVAGLQRNLDGEPIGVAGDNIFQMISRRYQQFSREGKFLAPDPK